LILDAQSNLFGTTAVSGPGGLGTVFELSPVSASLMITDSSIRDNSAAEDGGGLYNAAGTMMIDASTFSGNSADSGGGISNGGSLTLTTSMISGNSAILGGGIDNIGLLAIAESMLSDNSAVADGGGIFNDGGGVAVAGSMFLRNSAALGGGIANRRGVLALIADDFSDNEGGDVVDVT
jgi:hypothetical protein